jgi:serine/threonine-protein kinase
MLAADKELSEREQRLGELIFTCLNAAEDSQQVGEEVIARHPEFAAELAEFFADREKFVRLAAPIREVAQAAATAGALADPTRGDKESSPTLAGRSFADYELLSEIGAGGMGVVYKARQKSLNRLVALKMIRLSGPSSESEVQRFRQEAETVALLDHPHIVPVYEVGELEGQPYFTMKLITGGSLAKHLPRFTADLRSAANLLVLIARAIHHAHQRGVLHRDLKPANILLTAEDAEGRRGKSDFPLSLRASASLAVNAFTPLITDFGLAKRLEGKASLTDTGSIVGTPAYMAPEQASGKRGTITTATDVYGLGNLLYAMLTGRAPFQGDTPLETLDNVKSREPEPPSRINRRVDRDLETICLKCLEKKPERRYGSAEELAEDLERWQVGEPIQARPIGMARRVAKWVRRHRILAPSMVVLLAALMLGGGLTWSWQRQEFFTEQAVNEDLRETDLWQNQERWPESLQALERATGRLAGVGPASLRERIESRRRDVALVAELEEARSWTGVSFDYTGADRAYEKAFAEHGLTMSALTAQQIRASAIRTPLLEALDDWEFFKEKLRAGSGEPLRTLANLADDDPWRKRVRDPQVRRDRAALERLAREDGVLAQPPTNLVLLGRALDAVKGRPAAVALLRRAQERHPADFWINFELAILLHEPATIAEAVGFWRAAIALRPRSPAAYSNLGFTLELQGKVAQAVDACNKAIELMPDYGPGYNNLGVALYDQRKFAEAESAFRKALELEPSLAIAWNNLGNALRDQDKLVEAEAAHRKAITLQPDYADAHADLATTLKAQGKPPQAMEEDRKALLPRHTTTSALPWWSKAN